MGCTGSISNETMDKIIDQQIKQIKDGSISPLSYQIFLNNFYYVSRYKNFYTDLPSDKQISVLENIGPLSKDECSIFVENVCKYSESEEVLLSSLQQISHKMICQTTTQGTTSNLAVSQDKKLFKSIMQKKFETQFGKYKVKDTMIDWSNIDTTKERSIEQPPQIQHTIELSLIIQNNPIDNLWKQNDINTEDNPLINKNVTKPLFWGIKRTY